MTDTSQIVLVSSDHLSKLLLFLQLVLSGLLAVAVAAPSAIIGGPLASSTVVRGPVANLVGPSGTVIADTGAVVSTPVASAVVAPSVAQNIVVGNPWAASGLLGVPGVWGHSGVIAAPGLLGHNLWGHGLHGGQVILG